MKYNGLFDYYKKQVYEHGYYMCERDKKYHTDNKNVDNDIYFNDEMDYYICADYYSMAVDGFTDADKKFLAVLGFVESDFIENEMVEGADND